FEKLRGQPLCAFDAFWSEHSRPLFFPIGAYIKCVVYLFLAAGKNFYSLLHCCRRQVLGFDMNVKAVVVEALVILGCLPNNFRDIPYSGRNVAIRGAYTFEAHVLTYNAPIVDEYIRVALPGAGMAVFVCAVAMVTLH